MPELPEVENTRRGLEQVVLGKTIQTIDVFWENLIVFEDSIEGWIQRLVGQTIQSVGRRGKYLVFQLNNDLLVSHLRMEGKYFYFPEQTIPEEKEKHTHLIFHFTDGSQLHYHDVRKFGRFELIQKGDAPLFFQQKKIGPEPTAEAFDINSFTASLIQSKRAIKTYLLSQVPVAGLGNIYVDEVLWMSHIHPESRADILTIEQISLLHQSIIDIMERATALGGSTIRTYRNTLGEQGRYQDELQVYGKQGTPCPKCGTLIEKMKVHGRGTHYCPQCQNKVGEA